MSDFRNEAGQISGKLATDGSRKRSAKGGEVSLAFKTTAPK